MTYVYLVMFIAGLMMLLWWVVVLLEGRAARRLRDAQDQAIAITRHPSGQIPPEDRPDWPPHV